MKRENRNYWPNIAWSLYVTLKIIGMSDSKIQEIISTPLEGTELQNFGSRLFRSNVYSEIFKIINRKTYK
jgi:hypothetical protein